jgi:hypothetical protein
MQFLPKTAYLNTLSAHIIPYKSVFRRFLVNFKVRFLTVVKNRFSIRIFFENAFPETSLMLIFAVGASAKIKGKIFDCRQKPFFNPHFL